MAKALAETGLYDVHLSYSLYADSYDQFQDLKMAGLIVPTYRTRAEFIFGWGRMLHQGLRLRRYARAHDIDVVLSPMLSLWQSLTLPLAARSLRYVSVIHDGVLHDGDRSLILRLCYWLEFRYADAIVVLSESVAEQVSGMLRVHQQLVRTVHGAFPSETMINKQARRDTSDELRVGLFGRLNPYKGLDIFLDSLSILRARGVHVNGVVHGSGGPEVQELAKKHADVDWSIGWVDEAQINSLVRSFDVLALPYVEASQSGIVALALAEGTPMVATPVGGLRQQVEESGAGLVATEVSAVAFADALQALAESEELRGRLSRAGLMAAKTTYAWSRVAEDLRPALLKGTAVGDPRDTA